LDDDLIVKMIDHSYERVVAGFARKMKEEFEKFS